MGGSIVETPLAGLGRSYCQSEVGLCTASVWGSRSTLICWFHSTQEFKGLRKRGRSQTLENSSCNA
eukprot:4741977-Amphidinium_carterae.1